jgi:hypothetical protein
MTRPVPDRLCAEKTSSFYIANHPLVRISVNGIEFTGRVLEYCISKGWAKVINVKEDGSAMQSVRGGRVSCKMKHGKVVVWFACDLPPEGAIAPGSAMPTEQHLIKEPT